MISNDQNGFVPERYIGLNIQRIFNLIELCKDKSIPGLLLNIDFEKAFDSVEWKFIYKTLSTFGFPEQFISYIQVLYKDITACVINNGNFSKFFKLHRGVRQGCPLSPYLFVLSAEILSLYIKQVSGIKGIEDHKYNYLISQFADDTSLAIEPTESNLRQCFKVLQKFQEISGLKVNIQKTEALELGPFKGPICPELKIKWVERTTRVLGIHIAKEVSESIEANYKGLLDRIAAKLNNWSRRGLSLLGKINILKCLGMSQSIFLFTMLPKPNQEYIKELEQLLYKFIWGKSRDRIKRLTLIGPPKLGGAKMTDVESVISSINIGWVKRLVNSPGTWCSYIVKDIPIPINKENLKYFFKGNLHPKDISDWFRINPKNKWAEILMDWCKFNYKCPELFDNRLDILNENLWFNSCIKIGGKTTCLVSWFEAGIKYLKDLSIDYRWKTLDEIETEFKLRPKLLDYLGILHSINKEWRLKIKTIDNLPIVKEKVHNITTLCHTKKGSKYIYDKLVTNKCEIPTTRWENWVLDLDTEVDEVDWLNNLPNLLKCSTSTRMRSYIYSFSLRDILTNSRLFKMGLVESEQCYLCNHYKETLIHLYWECPHSQRLWERLKLYIYEESGLVIRLEKCILLLGINPANPEEKLPLILILLSNIVKKYIHNSHCKKKFIHVEGLMSYIYHVKNMEENIARRQGENAFAKFHKKWNWIF